MAAGTLAKLTPKGIERMMMMTIEGTSDWWRNHCTPVTSQTMTTPYGWPGNLPKPREMVDGRVIQEIRAFDYNLVSKVYELTFLIPRLWLEDDQTDSVRQLLSQVGESWANYKAELFTYYLENGGTLTAYDGTAFFDDTRTEGASAAIDNNWTSAAAADSAIYTSAEFLAQMAVIMGTMSQYQDDRGRKGMMLVPMTNLRLIIPRHCQRPTMEALNATQISGTDNVFGRGIADFDVNDLATVDATPTMTMYVHAIGGSGTKGMIYNQRTPLSVVAHGSPEMMDLNDGWLVTCRERFSFHYGQFRRLGRHIWTT
jgi:hypothetical protein